MSFCEKTKKGPFPEYKQRSLKKWSNNKIKTKSTQCVTINPHTLKEKNYNNYNNYNNSQQTMNLYLLHFEK